MKYWENKEYIALGIGASFYTEGFRGKNLLGFNDYYNAKTRNTSVDMSKYIFGCKHSKN